MIPTPARGETQDQFSNGKDTKTIYATSSGTTRGAANITLPYDATVDSAAMKVTTFYNNGSYLDEPALKIKPKTNDIIIWEFDGQGYGEFGRQTMFSDEKRSKSFDFPDDGDEFTAKLRMPKDAEISRAVAEIEGEAIGYGDVTRPENVTGGTHYPHSTVNTPDIVRGGSNLYAVWVDSGDLDYANTDYDIFFKYSEDDGESWSETRLLTNVSTTACYHPEIAAYGNYVYVIWQSTGSRLNFRISDDNGKSWGSSYYFTDAVLWSYSVDGSSIAAASDGRVYICWEESDGIYKILSNDYGESWGDLEKVSYDVSGMSYSEPTMAADGDHVYIGYVGYYYDQENLSQEYTLVCANSSNSGQDWEHSNVTSAVNETIAMPQVAAYHGSNVYFVTATDQDSDSGNITFIRSDDNTQSWNDPETVSGDPLQAASDPDISVFKGMMGSDLYVCWEHIPVSGTRRANISFSKSVDNGDSWQGIPTPITTSDDNFDPSITSDMLSRVYIVWNKQVQGQLEGYEDIYIRRSGQDGGNTWNDEELLSTETFDGQSSYSTYYMEGDNHYFAWMEQGNHTGNGNDYDVFFRYKDEGSDIWHEQIVVSDDDEDGERVGYPKVAADEDDNVYVVWLDNGDFDGDGTADTDVLFRTATNHGNGAWSQTELISRQTGTNSTSYLNIAARVKGVSNYVGVCWSESDGYGGSGTDQDIFFRISEDGGTSWQAIEVVSRGSTNTSYYPDISMDDSFVYVIWDEYSSSTGEYYIFVAKRPLAGGAWEIQEIVSNTYTTRYANIASSGDGYLYASWIGYPVSSYYLYCAASGDSGESWGDAVETDIVTSSPYYYQLGAYEDFVALVYSYSSTIYVNASTDRGGEGSWLGSVEVSIDGNSTSALYPQCAPSPDKDGIYCAWTDRGNVSGTSYDNDVVFAELSLSERFPEDPAVDVGADGDDEWSHAGTYKETEQFDFKSELQQLLDDADVTDTDLYNNAYVDINITISSEDKGRLILRNLTIEYNVSALVTNFDGELRSYLGNNEDEKDEYDNIRIPIDFYTRSPGALHLSELEVEYSFEPYLDLLTSPDLVSGELEITWEADHFGGEDLALYYYNYSEETPKWKEITTIDPDVGTYLWDVSGHNGEFKLKAERADSKDPSEQTLKFKIDNLAPKSTESISPTSHVNGWRTEADVYITSNDFDGSGGTGSDIDKVYYTLDGTVPDNNSLVYEEGSYIYFTTSGNHSLKYYAVDNLGHREAIRTVELKIDEQIPVVSLPGMDLSVYDEGSMPVEVVVKDNLSGFDFSSVEDEPFFEYAIGTAGDKGNWTPLKDLDYSSTTGTTIHVTGYTEDEDWVNLGDNYFYLKATVNDSLGNNVDEMELDGILIRDDTEKPDIFATHINWSLPSMTPGSLVTITVVTGEEGLNGNVTINSTEYLYACDLEASGIPGEYMYQWDTTGVEPYIYDLTIALWDDMGNTETIQKYITVREEPKPDVQVSSILLNDGTALEKVGIGATVYVNVTLYNYGDADGIDVVVIFKDNGEEFDRVTVDLIEPNKNKKVTGVWVVSGKKSEKHSITAHVGEGGHWLAYDEELELKEYPDFTVISLGVYEKGKLVTTLKKGTEYKIKAEVENQGDVLVSSVLVTFEYRTASSQVGLIGNKIIDLNKGETKPLELTWKPTSPGVVTVFAIADPDEAVPEINENNNQRTVEVTIEQEGGGSSTSPTEDDDEASILLPVMVVVLIAVAGVGVFFIMKQKKESEQLPEDEQTDEMYRLQEEESEAEEPVAEEIAAPPPQKTKLKCPSCSTVLSVSSPKRPLRINCPTCTTSILLKEEGGAVADKKEGEKKEEAAPVKLKCSGCDAVMVIKQTQRPIVVKCPKCQTKTTLDK